VVTLRRQDGWIWGRTTDLAVFGGSAALALTLAAFAPELAPDAEVPLWAWLAFVLAIDVAHVWTTLFRTYLDREELASRPLLYAGLPVACYAVGVALHRHSALLFWRVLAYVAVFHFVRQQVGWVAIYRARAGVTGRLDRALDDAVIYAATLLPLLHWHANLPRAFQWFVPGDFIHDPSAQRLLAELVLPGAIVYLLLAIGYCARSLQLARQGRALWGKHLVVVSTAATWFFGIVARNDDFAFTVTNVTVHGIPYMALLWAYARARALDRPTGRVALVVGWGVGGFFAVALGLACAEELLWDGLIWHDRGHLFRGGYELGVLTESLVVPLLALPQTVHYALDGVLWRSKDAGIAQARALGFAG
jgi:hypothetical protein